MSVIFLQHFLFVSLYYIYILLLVRELMGHEGLMTLHNAMRISCIMMWGKFSKFDSVVTWLAQLTSFSVAWQIFHSPTAQASAAICKKLLTSGHKQNIIILSIEMFRVGQ